MKNKLIIILLLLSSTFLNAQIANNSELNNLSEDISEKSVLFTDRDLYFSGEYLCFKVYNLINHSIQNEDLSKVVYIEIFNQQQSIIKEKFMIRDGSAEGIILIPDEMISGNYFMRAYTKFQRNLSPESIFTRHIRIINPKSQLHPTQINPEQDIKTALIEGNIEMGQNTKVAFFIQPYLIQAADKVCLVNSKEDSIQILKPAENGLGEFTFSSSESSEYFIKIELKDGHSVKKAINKAKNPFLVKTFSTEEILRVNIGLIENSTSFSAEDSLRFTVLSPSYKTRGESLFKIKNKTASIVIAQDILEEGINFLLIKNKIGSILKIHPVFKHSNKKSNIEIKTDKTNYQRRSLVNVQMSIPESLTLSDTYLSISVTKKGSMMSAKHLPASILENAMLLNSWMLLNELENNLKSEIELLMMLFEEKLNNPESYISFANRVPSKTFWLPETRGVSISGLIRNKITKEGSENIKITASTFGEDGQTHFTTSASDGSFLFAFDNLNGEQSISLKMPEYESENHEFMIHNDFAELPNFRNSPMGINQLESSTMNEMYFNHQSQNIFNETPTDTLSSLKFTNVSWIPDTTIYMKNYVPSESMEQLIDEILPFVHARKANGDYSISIQDKEVYTNYSSPLILIDNYPVSNLNAFLELNPKAIEKVSLNYTPQNHGEVRLNGIISFFTKTDNFAGYPTKDASVFINYKTANISQKLKFETYEDNLKLKRKTPDFRNLLYWEPGIRINHQKSVSFYTSDNISEYEIMVRGISEGGELLIGKTSINIIR